MKFVIAPDSFKGCMTAKQACAAIRDGLLRVFPDAEYVMVPMADGGEGTVRSLVDATHGRICSAQVLDPLQRETFAEYGILGNANDSGLTAIIEMSAASGIQFVDEHTRNPLVATTYGTGQLMKHALDDGVRTIILGVGGSATNDGGAGMAEALGVRFLDEHGNPIPRGGGFLDRLATVDVSGLDPRIANTRILIASDVTNPLVGPTGASAVFGPQKGATPQMVTQLDNNLAHYAAVIKDQLGIDVAHTPGAGGAGGLGAGLLAFTQSTMRAGVDIVLPRSVLSSAPKAPTTASPAKAALTFRRNSAKRRWEWPRRCESVIRISVWSLLPDMWAKASTNSMTWVSMRCSALFPVPCH